MTPRFYNDFDLFGYVHRQGGFFHVAEDSDLRKQFELYMPEPLPGFDRVSIHLRVSITKPDRLAEWDTVDSRPVPRTK